MPVKKQQDTDNFVIKQKKVKAISFSQKPYNIVSEMQVEWKDTI